MYQAGRPEQARKIKKEAVPWERDGLKIKPGNVLLSRDLHLSTIAAEGLNGRVRNGNGCFPLAMVTGKMIFRQRRKKSLHRMVS